MKIYRFEDLEIWKLSLIITKVIYDLVAKERFKHDFVLVNQIKRATISISSNIVEGFEKNNNNKFIRFLKISKGSVGEVRNQINIALITGYIDNVEFNSTNDKLLQLAKQIGGFIVYLQEKRHNKEFLRK
ncbi:four helix bundle protein [Candidatus Roizmanbacteria bacterium CG_4_10_14_0_8_um_filter_33_9]|uniref:Four helix bundle protein n=1 Tax=Candidatus Roizmanbacteria bacterium CG_4_10_14_0_8_um_filter_33_9 TaxID=1974826 RepID=A0A2M7QHG2_9BACT|nr:MAG: four helix bundle protein [Candidatus Roizmanbacteria bacterium CG_4_10_14_0_8_um_filter_33_9]